MKLAVPPIVKAPVLVIAPPDVTLKFPVVVTPTPKPTPDPASKVKLLNEEAVVEKVTEEAEFKVSAPKLEEDTPSTIMAPFDTLPTVRLPAVIWLSSLSVREKVPVPDPKPMVEPDWAVRRVVPAVPEVIAPVELKDILLEVMVNALLLVVSVLPAEIEKSPVPSPSESELKLVVPFVVRLEVSAIPFSAFTVRPWKVESDVPKVTEEPEAVAFKVSAPNWSVLPEETPSTAIFPLVPSPMVRLPAVIWPSSVSVREKVPVPEPNPMVVPD